MTTRDERYREGLAAVLAVALAAFALGLSLPELSWLSLPCSLGAIAITAAIQLGRRRGSDDRT